jgi:hypothetical protein
MSGRKVVGKLIGLAAVLAVLANGRDLVKFFQLRRMSAGRWH